MGHGKDTAMPSSLATAGMCMRQRDDRPRYLHFRSRGHRFVAGQARSVTLVMVWLRAEDTAQTANDAELF
jgi:hypothetical protein